MPEQQIQSPQRAATPQVAPATARKPTGAGNAAAAQAVQKKQDAELARDAATQTGTESGKVAEAEGEAPAIQVSAGSFVKQGLSAEVFGLALTAFRTAWAAKQTRKTIFTVIDFSQPSDQKRMYVIDLAEGKLLFQELVTHGSKSGGRMATDFSNTEGSNQSSLGLSRTAETYQSAKFGGTALRIDGLEKGFNDQMRNRAVVMHQADYATPAAIAANKAGGVSRLGRSQGCPAMDPKVAGKVIETVKNGTLIFTYAPDPNYVAKSAYLKGGPSR